MTQKWQEIADGYGLVELPPTLAKELGCCMCSPEFPTRGKIYTPEPLPTAVRLEDYSRQVNRLRGKCYCKTHARLMYGENV